MYFRIKGFDDELNLSIEQTKTVRMRWLAAKLFTRNKFTYYFDCGRDELSIAMRSTHCLLFIPLKSIFGAHFYSRI